MDSAKVQLGFTPIPEYPIPEYRVSPLPVLNPLTEDESEISTDKFRDLSLTLSKVSHKHAQKVSKFEYTSKLLIPCSQKTAQNTEVSLLPTRHMFTLEHSGHATTGITRKSQSLSAHNAEVHATFDENLKRNVSSCPGALHRESLNTKLYFLNQRHLTRLHQRTARSMDDISQPPEGETSERVKSILHNRSSSSEPLSPTEEKQFAVSGGAENENPHKYLDSCRLCSLTSATPSFTCTSTVPAVATSNNETLDSDLPTVRLAVLGAPGVGKSSIVRQFVLHQFVEEYVPTEEKQIYYPVIIINNRMYDVRITDYPYIQYFPVDSFQEWRDFRGYGLRNATAYVLVYDITSEETFQYIKSLRSQIIESLNNEDVPIFVVANKRDILQGWILSRGRIRKMKNLVKKKWKCAYTECSAKYNWQIMNLFKEIMKTVDSLNMGHNPRLTRFQDAFRRSRCLIL